MRRTHQVVRQPVAGEDDHIAPIYTHIVSLRILHRLVPAVRTDLERKVERMLHFGRPEHNLAVANQE